MITEAFRSGREMTLVRNSVGTWLFVTALVALMLAPLYYLTDPGILVLMYARFGLMITATFLARFGERRHRTWWFGFSACGWAAILFSVPGLWSLGSVNVAPGIDLADLSASIAFQLADGSLSAGRVDQLAAVVDSWFNLLAAFTGGMMALALDRRGRQLRRARHDHVSDRTNPW
jgi:hypothetical protein